MVSDKLEHNQDQAAWQTLQGTFCLQIKTPMIKSWTVENLLLYSGIRHFPYCSDHALASESGICEFAKPSLLSLLRMGDWPLHRLSPLLCMLSCGSPDLTSCSASREHLKAPLPSMATLSLPLSHLSSQQPWHNWAESTLHDFLISLTSWDSMAKVRSVLCDQCFPDSTSCFNQDIISLCSDLLRQGCRLFCCHPSITFCLPRFFSSLPFLDVWTC